MSNHSINAFGKSTMLLKDSSGIGLSGAGNLYFFDAEITDRLVFYGRNNIAVFTINSDGGISVYQPSKKTQRLIEMQRVNDERAKREREMIKYDIKKYDKK